MDDEADEDAVTITHRAAFVLGGIMVLWVSGLLACPPPQVETAAVCHDSEHASCGLCASTRACLWCIDDGRCIARDPTLGDTCGGNVARVTEACE